MNLFHGIFFFFFFFGHFSSEIIFMRMDLHLISRVIWPRLFQNKNWLAVNVLFEVCSTKYYICFHPGF